MTQPRRELHFNSCIDHLDLAWREPYGSPSLLFDFNQLAERANLAERGLMDAMFIADFYTYRPGFSLEPLTLLSALAGVTSNIGLIASVSTTYNEPFDIARMFASLNRLSGERAGWNMVTTAIDAVSANYGLAEHLEHDRRYQRANEVIEVVTGLWGTLTEDGLKASRTGGICVDPDRVQLLEHHGEWFDFRGLLDIPQTSQGYPLLMQAGSSQAGRSFGARWAEVIFTAQPVISIAREFYSDMQERAADHGRDANAIRILPGFMPVVAPERTQALEVLAARREAGSNAARRMKDMIGIDVSCLPADEPIPLQLLPERGLTNGMRGRSDLYLEIVRKHRLTPNQLLQQGAHLVHAGNPKDMADLISEWFTTFACDGFTLMWPSLEANRLFVDEVVPILQRRGLYRRAYGGKRLHDNFGLYGSRSRAAERPIS